MMTIQLFVDINDDWSRTVKSRKMQKALPRWQRWEPALRGHRSFDDLLVMSASRNREQADDVLRALLSVGHEDSLAWRTVLQAVLPGVVKIARSFIPGPHSDEEVAAAVVAIAWGRIAEYPLERRPNAIGANIVLDTRQQAARTAFKDRRAEIPTCRIGHLLPPVFDAEDPARAVLGILRRAVHDNVVSLDDARLVAFPESRTSLSNVSRSKGESSLTASVVVASVSSDSSLNVEQTGQPIIGSAFRGAAEGRVRICRGRVLRRMSNQLRAVRRFGSEIRWTPSGESALVVGTTEVIVVNG